MPPKRQTGSWVRLHVLGFPAGAPIAVDDEPGGVKFLEVDEPAGNGARGQMGGGQADGLGLVDVGLLGVVEPGVELGEWGRGELVTLQGALCVLVGLLRGFSTGGSN